MVNALDILNNNPNLMSIYLLHAISINGPTTPSEKSASFFLLWCVARGRQYFDGILIDAKFYEFLTQPSGAYLSRLEMFAHTSQKDQQRFDTKDINQLHLWYYGHVVPELDLYPFITARERQAFAEIAFEGGAPGLRMSLLEKLACDECEIKIDLRNAGDEQKWRSRLAAKSTINASFWLREHPKSTAVGAAGVNLIGYADGTFGIGEDLRALASVLDYCNIPFVIRNVPIADERAKAEAGSDGFSKLFSNRCLFPVNIFCMTATETERLRLTYGMSFFVDRYNIAYWPWELSSIPPSMRHVFGFVDEIWAMSPFLAEVFSKHTAKPVVYMPPYANANQVEKFDRSSFDIGNDEFVCLTMADFNSRLTRKNPYGAIDAFHGAFDDAKGGERLIVKTINGHMHGEEFDRLLKYVAGDSRITVMDGALSRAETCGLIAAADCFISLHRSEGFGRPIAEAMSFTTPVVATDWSGSTSLLNNHTGFPVSFQLRDVRPDEYWFHEGSQWAEPSLPDAIAKLRSVRVNSSAATSKAQKARARIAKTHGIEPVAQQVAARLSKIAARASRGASR